MMRMPVLMTLCRRRMMRVYVFSAWNWWPYLSRTSPNRTRSPFLTAGMWLASACVCVYMTCMICVCVHVCMCVCVCVCVGGGGGMCTILSNDVAVDYRRYASKVRAQHIVPVPPLVMQQ